MSCDALQCGLRHYLHDDFDAIRLDPKLISLPSVLLWPERSDVLGQQPDVGRELIEKLAEDEDEDEDEES